MKKITYYVLIISLTRFYDRFYHKNGIKVVCHDRDLLDFSLFSYRVVVEVFFRQTFAEWPLDLVTKDDLLMISHSKSIIIEVCSIQDLTAARNL